MKAGDADPVHVEQFLQRLAGAKSPLAVQECLQAISRRYGFDNFYTCIFPAAGHTAPTAVMGDFPQPFLEQYIAREWWRDDPVALLNQRRMTPYSWRDAPATTPEMQTFREILARSGAMDGLVIPWHIPDSWSGFCSFSVSGRNMLPDVPLPELQYLVIHAADALHRLQHRREHPRLTPRQVQCVILVAQGKSDWVAGQLLGLSPATIHKYLEQAKARYGVSSRTELVVRALHDKQISFADLLN